MRSAIIFLILITVAGLVEGCGSESDTPAITIQSPRKGTQFTCGQPIEVVVTASGFQPSKGKILVSIGEDSKEITGPPFAVTMKAPDDMTGRIRITAMGFRETMPPVVTGTVEIEVRPSSPMVGLAPIGEPFVLAGPKYTCQMSLYAVYGDGKRRRADASIPLEFSIEDSYVATVSADGKVTAHHPGQTKARIKSGTLATEMTVVVMEPPDPVMP